MENNNEPSSLSRASAAILNTMGCTSSKPSLEDDDNVPNRESKSDSETDTQRISTTPQPLSRADLEAAIAKYAPVIQYHPDEQYNLCSIEWFLSHCILIDSKDSANPKTTTIVHPTQAQLPQAPPEEKRYYLDVEDTAKPGDYSTGKAYVNALWLEDKTYTDIQFWLFNAYNGHATARFDSLVKNKVKHEGDINLAPLGEHWADWEYVAIRIDNTTKEMIGIILSAHGKNPLYDEAAISQQFKFVNGTHPVVYASLDGHANYPSVGPNFTENRKILGTPLGLDFNLLNTTADGGKSFNCAANHEVVAAEWLKDTPDAYSIPLWVGYPYGWGPEGTTIQFEASTLGDFIVAGLGKDGFSAYLLHDPIVLLVSELLHVFVKANINGAAAPATQAPWVGNY